MGRKRRTVKPLMRVTATLDPEVVLQFDYEVKKLRDDGHKINRSLAIEGAIKFWLKDWK